MYKVIDEGKDNVVGIQVSGKLNNDHLEQLKRWLQERIERQGRLRLLIDMDAFRGWQNPKVFWNDLKFDVRHNKDIERLAMVGDKRWQRWMTRLSQPFIKARVRYFDRHDLSEAWQWLRASKA